MKVRTAWKARDDVVLEAAVADSRLSFRAKGVLAFLLSSEAEASFELKELVAASSEGTDALRTALTELEYAGYCERIEMKDEGGTPAEADPAPPVATVPVMDSLFGESFAPPIPINELLDASPEGEGVTSEDAVIEKIIRRLNELRERHWDWAHYTPLQARYPKNVEKIKQRLRDGHTEQDLILVLEYRAAVDGGDEKSRRYFNSDTPFNTRNFEENLALALDWSARGRGAESDKRFGTERGADYYMRRKRRDT